MKRILVPNGNYTDIRLIQAFKKMGYYVITSGNAPELEGHKYADEYIPHDYSDKEGMLELARNLNLDNISACSNDFGVVTAAYIAEKLGLPGHDTFRSAQIIAEKDHFKRFALENNLQVIPSAAFTSIDAAKKAVMDMKYPIIVKPTDLGGGKGVTKVTRVEDADAAIDLAFAKSKAKHIVIEPFVEGNQGSFTGFLVNKKVVTYTSFNEYDAWNNPFLVGYTTSPADDMDEISKVMIEQTEKMAVLLDLVDGIFHIQYRVWNGVPYIMECMRRNLGNYALRGASYLSGFEWEEWIAKSYCGMDCSAVAGHSDKGKNVAEYYIQVPRNGVVKDVVIDPIIDKYTYDSIMQWHPGQVIDNSSTAMLGFLFLDFPSVEIRDEVSSHFSDYIKVVME
ncbi:MAG: hypothetical protein ILP16_07140 [Spirochaetales bacterium]|nr:hypothetical protein [Spirochaetales bacterium]